MRILYQVPGSASQLMRAFENSRALPGHRGNERLLMAALAAGLDAIELTEAAENVIETLTENISRVLAELENARNPVRRPVVLSNWLTAFEGRPAPRPDGWRIENLRRQERNALGDRNARANRGVRGINWSAFMPDMNPFARAQYERAGRVLDAVQAPNGGYINNDGRYWAAFGPEILRPGYNTDFPGSSATLNESHFQFGTEIDVVLQRISPPHEDVFIECIAGCVKAHTFPYGIFQTGDVYPHSDNAKRGEDGSAHRDGSYVEFIGRPIPRPGGNGIMREFMVVDITVYRRSG